MGDVSINTLAYTHIGITYCSVIFVTGWKITTKHMQVASINTGRALTVLLLYQQLWNKTLSNFYLS